MSVKTKTKKSSEADTSVTSIYAVVSGVDNEGEAWKEAADVFSHTSSGVGFHLPRPCGVGTLISMMLNLPAHLRVYDHEEEFYRVWGLVQNCHLSSSDDVPAYQIGVGFIGDEAPSTYGANPHQNYRICGMTEDGLWKVTESDTKFVQRKELRYWKQIELYLALIDGRRETVGGERVKTENISKSGAAVMTSLDLNTGDRLKIISEKYDFSGLAVVCNLSPQDDGMMRLSLEFVENEFPVEKLQEPATDK